MARDIATKYGEKSEAVRLTGLLKDVEDMDWTSVSWWWCCCW